MRLFWQIILFVFEVLLLMFCQVAQTDKKNVQAARRKILRHSLAAKKYTKMFFSICSYIKLIELC